MDLFNMTNRAQIHEIYKKVKIEEIFFIFQTTVLKFGDLLWNGSDQQIQNFSTISPKLCQLGNKTGTRGVNTTVVHLMCQLS